MLNFAAKIYGMRRYFEIILFFIPFVSADAQIGDNPLRDSLRNATEVLAYHPDSVDLRLKKAAWNIELEQWSYALTEYDFALNADPDNIAALYYRAYVNGKLGRYNFARLDYTNLLKKVPGNFEAQLGLALLNQKDKHYTESFDQINRLVNQFPDSAVAYAARAGIEKERKMYEVAEFDYGEAIKHDAANSDFILNRANIRLLLGKDEEAKADLDRLVVMGVPKANLVEMYKRLKKK